MNKAENPRKALGKGLGALLPTRQIHHPAPPEALPEDAALALAIDSIDPNPLQPRRVFQSDRLSELAQSIRANGIIQPLVVRRSGERYQLVAGERRWRAAKLAGLVSVQAVVREIPDDRLLEITLIENLQREDLNPLEQARAFERLGREFGLTQEQIAQRTGKDRSTISNFLRLLKLPNEVQAMVERGALSFGHAKALMGLDSPETIHLMAKRAAQLSLSVRQTEKLVTNLIHPPEKVEKQREIDPNVKEAERSMRASLGMAVTIQDKHGKGKVVIEYANLEDFDRLMEALVEAK